MSPLNYSIWFFFVFVSFHVLNSLFFSNIQKKIFFSYFACLLFLVFLVLLIHFCSAFMSFSFFLFFFYFCFPIGLILHILSFHDFLHLLLIPAFLFSSLFISCLFFSIHRFQNATLLHDLIFYIFLLIFPSYFPSLFPRMTFLWQLVLWYSIIIKLFCLLSISRLFVSFNFFFFKIAIFFSLRFVSRLSFSYTFPFSFNYIPHNSLSFLFFAFCLYLPISSTVFSPIISNARWTQALMHIWFNNCVYPFPCF